MTYFPPHLLLCYGITHVTSSQSSMRYIIFQISNSQSKTVHRPNKVCHMNIKHKKLLFYNPSFSYNEKTNSEVRILTLVTTITQELSFTVDS